MATDQPDKRKSRRAISDAEDKARIEALLTSIGDGVIATDNLGNITRVNQAALDILGYKKSEVMHKRFPDKIQAVYDNGLPVKVIDRPIAKAFLTGKSVSQRMVYKRKDGRAVPVQLTVSPVIFSKKPMGAIEVFRDVSSEIRDEKLKSDFISIASHQLRTPLSSINIYSRMLEDGMAGELNERQKIFVSTILASVDRMNELIDTLLNVTRIEAGGLAVNIKSVEVSRLLQQILAEMKPAMDDKSLQLVCDLPDDELQVHSDGLLLKEIFANLLANAVKYTPNEGRVRVSLALKGADIIFSVSDSGIGIPLHAQKHIFSKFFRADNVLQKEVGGTGLGLYLTKLIGEQLGGDVWFESEENEGSTFYLSLPAGSSAKHK
jgi:PAS domain S-box-containing protein